MLEIEDLSVAYGRIEALRGVSLRVEEGGLACLIGANGAGKTTLLRAISGLLPLRRGRVTFQGREISGRPPEAIVRLGVSQVPEGRQLFTTLTVRDNLLLGAYPCGRRSRATAIAEGLQRVYAFFPVLQARQRQLAGTLSGGEQQMLAIGRVLMARPRVLLLDEPSVGLAPRLVREIFRKIQELHAQGTTILLVEQNARAALRIADHGYVLETGRIVLEGKSQELIEHEAVRKAYLGS